MDGIKTKTYSLSLALGPQFILLPFFCEDKQEIRSVKDKPFYCHSSVRTIPFQARVFLLQTVHEAKRISAATFEPYANGDDDDRRGRGGRSSGLLSLY